MSLSTIGWLHSQTMRESDCISQSKQAIQDMEEQKVTEEFIHLSEIVFAVAGFSWWIG